MVHPLPTSIDQTHALLESGGYVAERETATVLFLALTLKRPLFIEGEPGTGKTEIAKVLSATLGRPLIRLQCYEGLDISSAVYEWNFSAQMIAIKLAESKERADIEKGIYAEKFLQKRPILKALEASQAGAPILLIDEIDRVDEAFEAYLLEVLSEFQVTIPEYGVIKASEPPIVIITSNRTREVHDAIKRRCLYHWVDYPTFDRELQIVQSKIPGIGEELSRQIVAFVQSLRSGNLFKPPGIAETLDWANALLALNTSALTTEAISGTLGALLKYQDDIAKLGREQINLRAEAARHAFG